MAWFGGYFKDYPFPTSCHGQEYLLVHQVAQSPIHLALNTPRDACSASCSELHHPHTQELLPNIKVTLVLFQFKAILPSCITACPCKKSLSVFPIGPLCVLKSSCKKEEDVVVEGAIHTQGSFFLGQMSFPGSWRYAAQPAQQQVDMDHRGDQDHPSSPKPLTHFPNER